MNIEQEIFTALPPGIVTCISTGAPGSFALAAEESQYSTNFSTKRLQDFVVGRFCASEVLRKMQIARVPILMGSSREPIWPTGVVGSIAHTAGLAGAIGAHVADYSAVGFDLEQLRPIDELSDQICTESELHMGCRDVLGDSFLNIVFSAKEAVYKCLWPRVRRFISFHEVELILNPRTCEFRMSGHKEIHPDISKIAGNWRIIGDVVVTAAVIANSRYTN